MNQFRLALTLVAMSLLSIGASAQVTIINYPHWIPISFNAITNPGFESGFSNWNTNNSYYEDSEGDFMNINLGYLTTDAHTGKYGFDMGLGNAGGGFLDCDLHQDLSTPVAVNSLYDASLWVQTSSNSVGIYITYTDNSVSGSSYNVHSTSSANNGFVHVNFAPSLTAGKTIKSIDIEAGSNGSDVVVDDISLSYNVWIFIP